MAEHDGVRAGDEVAAFALLERLARQTARSFRPPQAHGSWTRDAVLDLVCEAFAAKPGFLWAACQETTTDAQLERYLLRVLRNVLNDQGRQTERWRLIKRLKTILGARAEFVRHAVPFDGWRLASAGEEPWQGDSGTLVAAASMVPGRAAATAWSTSGPTPATTCTVIVNVSRAALAEADGVVPDDDVARVVQACVPAAPLDPGDVEAVGFVELVRRLPETGAEDAPDDGSPSPAQVASALWGGFDDDERVALRHLGVSQQAVGAALGLGRRATAAVVASVRAKVAQGTEPATREAVVGELHALATTDPGASGAGDDVEVDEDGAAS